MNISKYSQLNLCNVTHMNILRTDHLVLDMLLLFKQSVL